MSNFSQISLTTTQNFSSVKEAQDYLKSLDSVSWWQIQPTTTEGYESSYEDTNVNDVSSSPRVNTTPKSSSVNTHLRFQNGGEDMTEFKIKKYMNGYILRHKSNTQSGYPAVWNVD